MTMNASEWTEKLKWRYATKLFDTAKKIPADTWETIEDSLVLTPSSFGLQPWKFFVVTDQAKKDALVQHSWNQPQVAQCSHLVVLAARSPIDEHDVHSFIKSTHLLCGGEIESLHGYRDMMLGFISHMDDAQRTAWAKNQVYIALGQLMATAAVLGIDACPMEGIVPAMYDEILGVGTGENAGYTTVLACPMGYRAAEDKYGSAAKVRYAAEHVIEHI